MVTKTSDGLPLLVVGLGEALFDRFSPERVVLGGAPVNVAVHAHQLLGPRGEGIVASNLGADPLGDQVREEIAGRGMRTEFLTTTTDFPTGTVEVTVDEQGGPSYEIRENVAWDHLRYAPSWRQLADECSAVCFGTLAQRSPNSRKTIQQFLADSSQALHVLDLNLRQSYFSAELIDHSLRATNVLKLNEDELEIINTSLKLGAAVGNSEPPKIGAARLHAIDALIERYTLQLVALTRGKHGTALFTDQEHHEADVPEYPRQPNADSVGAGDACCAAITVGLLLGKPLSQIVELANHAGAFVASQPGATPQLPREILQRV